jgi:hypothetical protein
MELHIFQVLRGDPGASGQGDTAAQSIESRWIGGMLVNTRQTTSRQHRAARRIFHPWLHSTIRLLQRFHPHTHAVLQEEIGHNRLRLQVNQWVPRRRRSNMLRNGPSGMIRLVQNARRRMRGFQTERQVALIRSIKGHLRKGWRRRIEEQLPDALGSFVRDFLYGRIVAEPRSGPVNVGRQRRRRVARVTIEIAIDDAALGPVGIAVGRKCAGKEDGDGDAVGFGSDEGGIINKRSWGAVARTADDEYQEETW